MAISEIEKLERRYAENPQGLTFAPLAEIHRKNGDVARALELLGPGLALHPNYIPASIVLGRCHFDLGDMPAAETAFAHVLSLDSENVIALKALADITERLLRLDESEKWLETLVAIDRSNDDARDQLERVRTSRRQANTASSASPDAATDQDSPAPVGNERIETAPYESDLIPSMPFSPPATSSSILDEAADTPPAAPSPPPLPLAELPSEPPPLAFEHPDPGLDAPIEPVEPLSGIVGMTDSGDASHVEPFAGPVGDGFHVELSEEIVLESSGASEFQMPNASEEFLGPPAFEPQPTRQVSRPEPPPAPEPVREIEIAPLHIPEPEPVFAAMHGPPGTAPQELDPMMTESMAELLLRQGHREDALRVYRELDGRLGGSARIEERIADLERSRPVAAPRRQYAAPATGGRSTGELFRDILSARPPQMAPAAAVKTESPGAGAAPEAGGAPTRPAHDTLSLSSVFGEESAPSRPAVPAASSGSPEGVSYDDFFNTQPSGGPSRPPRSPDPKSDDLDQFHTWLQNLKR